MCRSWFGEIIPHDFAVATGFFRHFFLQEFWNPT
jgi:hypothetical protein